jgi:hypothetical protein
MAIPAKVAGKVPSRYGGAYNFAGKHLRCIFRVLYLVPSRQIHDRVRVQAVDLVGTNRNGDTEARRMDPIWNHDDEWPNDAESSYREIDRLFVGV